VQKGRTNAIQTATPEWENILKTLETQEKSLNHTGGVKSRKKRWLVQKIYGVPDFLYEAKSGERGENED